MRTPPPLAVVAGRNAKKIRTDAGVTLEQFARAARHCELPWTTGRAGSFESGRVNQTLATLLLVAEALGVTTKRRVELADLFDGPGRVTVSDGVTMDLGELRAVLRGKKVKLTLNDLAGARKRLIEEAGDAAEADFDKWHPTLQHVNPALRQRVYIDFTEADYRLAHSLDVSPANAAAAMAYRWRKTFVAERNRLAGVNANPQRRGRVSRELKAELRKVLGSDD
jgi:transcriptional regulator with XRE-family HTH domain